LTLLTRLTPPAVLLLRRGKVEAEQAARRPAAEPLTPGAANLATLSDRGAITAQQLAVAMGGSGGVLRQKVGHFSARLCVCA
jgi:hypothetical protein